MLRDIREPARGPGRLRRRASPALGWTVELPLHRPQLSGDGLGRDRCHGHAVLTP